MHNNKQMNKQLNTLRFIEIKPFLITFIFCSIYRALLDYIYVKLLSPSWSYSGFTYDRPGMSKVFISWIVIFIASFFCYKMSSIQRLSSIILQSLIYISFIPGVVFYTYKNQDFFGLYCLYWLFLVIFFFLLNFRETKPIQFNINEKVLSYVVVFFFLFCFYIWARYAHFRIQVDVLDIYGLREEAANYSMSSIEQYIYASVQVCIPFLAVWALENRKYFTFVTSCLAQLFAFFSQGSKTTFFALIVGVLVHFFVGGIKSKGEEKNSVIKKGRMVPIILKGMIIAEIGSIVEFFLLKSSYLVDYLCRRILMLPNLLNCYYYDYFSKNEFDYFRNSILRVFGFSSPYSNTKIPYIIGNNYFHSSSMYANNGLFSDAYLNMGIIGVVVLPFLIILLLRLFDKCMGKASLSLQIGATIYVVICLMGSSFFTNLFSHGFLLLALLFCFLNKDEGIVIKIGNG